MNLVGLKRGVLDQPNDGLEYVSQGCPFEVEDWSVPQREVPSLLPTNPDVEQQDEVLAVVRDEDAPAQSRVAQVLVVAHLLAPW